MVSANLGTMAQGFNVAMRLIKSHDPQQQEDGFDYLRTHAVDYIDELIEQFDQERDDQELRRWLLELIGVAKSPTALPTLTAQLDSPDEALRGWAVAGLSQLNTPEARSVLWRARANGTIT